MTTIDNPVALSEVVALLVVAPDGEEYVVGRPDLGLFVAVPPPGAVFIEALRAGDTVEQASAKAGEAAGEPVDGPDFLASLGEAGLLESPGASGSTDPGAPGRDSPGRGGRIRWIEGVSPRAAARLFGTGAWVCYGTAALVAVTLLATQPGLRPSFENLYFLADPVRSILAYLPLLVLLGGAHEAWHWLAGRALGIPAVFRISYRGVFVVFETDLTQIVTVARRLRYGAFFAGMALDSVVLALALLARFADSHRILALPGWLGRLLAAVVLGQVYSIVWQWAAVFLRSDVYAALANLLRCQNLYRTTWLTLKGRLFVLSDAEQAELVGASPRDRWVARWFSLAYLVGVTVMIWMYLTFVVPAFIALTTWLVGNLLGRRMDTLAFWESALVTLYVLGAYGGPALLALRERRLRRRGALL